VLQWTPNGLKKRQRFEEVAGSEQTPRGESSPLSHQSSSPDATIVRYGSTSSRASSPASSTSDFAVSLPPQPGLGVFLLQQIQNKCLDTYLPPRGEVMIDVKKTWMYTMSTLSCPGNALESSFAALSLARVGVVMKDNDLIAQGRGQYANALTRLKKALYDPETAFQDRTLAAMRTLSIYEVSLPAPLACVCSRCCREYRLRTHQSHPARSTRMAWHSGAGQQGLTASTPNSRCRSFRMCGGHSYVSAT